MGPLWPHIFFTTKINSYLIVCDKYFTYCSYFQVQLIRFRINLNCLLILYFSLFNSISGKRFANADPIWRRNNIDNAPVARASISRIKQLKYYDTLTDIYRSIKFFLVIMFEWNITQFKFNVLIWTFVVRLLVVFSYVPL